MRGGAVLATLVVLAGCTTAPYTRRSQLMLVSPEQETKLGAQAYQQVLAKSRVDSRSGLGAQVGVLLPYSRAQESEADHIGLLLMARAGYDPRGAVAFWQRMEQRAGSGGPPQFLSTHPSHGTREQQLRAWLPEALPYYEAAPHAPVEPLSPQATTAAR